MPSKMTLQMIVTPHFKCSQIQSQHWFTGQHFTIEGAQKVKDPVTTLKILNKTYLLQWWQPQGCWLQPCHLGAKTITFLHC